MVGISPYIKLIFSEADTALMPSSAHIKKDAELVLGIKITSTMAFKGVRVAWRKVLTRDDSERIKYLIMKICNFLGYLSGFG